MRALGMYLRGDAPEIRDSHGRHTTDDDFMLLLNTHSEALDFKLPEALAGWEWRVAFDTTRPELPIGENKLEQGSIKLAARSFTVLVHERAAPRS